MYFKFNDETHFYQNFIKNNLDILGDLIIIKEQLNITLAVSMVILTVDPIIILLFLVFLLRIRN